MLHWWGSACANLTDLTDEVASRATETTMVWTKEAHSCAQNLEANSSGNR